MDFSFYDCCSLKSLPDISKWNVEGVKSICGLFMKCSSLKLLPDISKWNTKNIEDICSLFFECSSLEFNDLYFYTNSIIDSFHFKDVIYDNIFNIGNIFTGCSSLKLLPDISKWDARKIIIFSDYLLDVRL